MSQQTEDSELQILRIKQQAELLGVSTVTLWRMRDELPPEVRISKGIKGRTRGSLRQFIEKRSAR
jgi:predicted DNA-binding transcriptional regulator AlpA